MPRRLSRRLALSVLVSSLALIFSVMAAAAGSPGTVSFTSTAYDVDEGAGKATITLTRTGGTEGAVTAKVSLAHVTTGPADYQIGPGSLDQSFAAVSPIPFFYYYQGMALQPDGKLVFGGSGSPLKRVNPDGTVDGGFNPPAFNAPVEAVAIQADGKIIVSGTFTGIPGMTRIARLNPDGSLDSSFNVGTGPNDDPVAIAVQPDGKIIVGGYFTSINQTVHKHVARLNADGSLDATFNADAPNCYALAIQPDGKILASTPFLYRFNTDGSFDGSVPSLSFFANAFVPRPDGKILLAGTLRKDGVAISNGVYRLNPDGTLDQSFTTGSGTDGYVNALAVQPDGKIIAGGQMASYNGTPTGCLIRLNPDGTLDLSFGAAQFFGANPSISQIALQPDGKVLANGSFTATAPTSSHTNLARFNGDIFVNWADGDAADKTVSIPVVDDKLDEPDETSTLTLNALTEGAATGAIPTATLTIRDNDVPPAITSGNPPQVIARVPYSHTFTATGTPAPTFSVTSGTLPPGLSLSPSGVLSGTVFSAGTYAAITVTASNGVAPTAGQTFDLTVVSGGALQFGSNSYSVAENGGSVTVTVNRVGGSAGTATVNYSAFSSTGASSGDYTLTPGTLTFADGETSKTFVVTILDDEVNERDETVTLSLGTAGGSGAVGTPSAATLTILNDDPLPTISVDDVTVTEGDSGTKQAVFTVTRTGLIDRTVSFTARTADGTAVANEDYAPLSGTQFFIGSSSASTSVPVSVYGDTLVEPDKTFVVNLSSPTDATIARAQGVGTIKDNDTTTGAPTVQFSARGFTAQEGAGVAGVTVTRSGDTSAPTTVSYSTVSGFGAGAASDRGDYTLAFGTLRFAAGESSKTFNVFVTDDALVEPDEFFNVTLGPPTGGASLGAPSNATVRIVDNDAAPSTRNPSDDTAFFVRQHYRDFLNRDPDADGLAFWTNEIEKCGPDAQCREVRRINVSAAFFLSIEFKETGYFVYLMHKAAFNAGERLALRTFMSDSQQIGRDVVVGMPGWEQKVEANKQAFVDSFVARTQFTTLYTQTLTPEQYVDALNANTGDPLNPSAGGSLTQAERDALVSGLAAGSLTRAQVLRAVAENAEFTRRQKNKAFVLMQYFGYLRRAPNETPEPGLDFSGYNFWLGKLNEFNGNFVRAEMVKAFITSDEYRKRFGQ